MNDRLAIKTIEPLQITKRCQSINFFRQRSTSCAGLEVIRHLSEKQTSDRFIVPGRIIVGVIVPLDSRSHVWQSMFKRHASNVKRSHRQMCPMRPMVQWERAQFKCFDEFQNGLLGA